MPKNVPVDVDPGNHNEYVSSQVLASSNSHSPSTVLRANIMMNHPFVVDDDLISQQDPSWTKMLMENESYISQPSFLPRSCPCNGVTGPCAGHLEKIHAQVLAGTVSPLSPHQQLRNHHYSDPDMPIPPPHQIPFGWSKLSRSRCVPFLFPLL